VLTRLHPWVEGIQPIEFHSNRTSIRSAIASASRPVLGIEELVDETQMSICRVGWFSARIVPGIPSDALLAGRSVLLSVLV
jgi:hypothetical protein